MQKRQSDGIHVRIDPVLVGKFKRLPGGVNEAGIKIVRDFGLRYNYDKHSGALDIVGEDAEILHIAIETLRFWVEDDDYPPTGITCQVGYPNRNIVVWRFHGDYAKKFNHLFSDDIELLKSVPSLFVKAVPTKRNPEYVEVFCNFAVFQQVKFIIERIAIEMEKIFQTDVFVPRSDFNKARKFARSKTKDAKVLYALKEYPENNKIRVWFFSRENQELIRAKKEWTQHVGMIARDNRLVEEEKVHGVDMKSAVYFGHPASALTSERSSPQGGQKPDTLKNYFKLHKGTPKRQSLSDIAKTSPRAPKYDNKNFPRPHDFVYPISLDEDDAEFNEFPGKNEYDRNPFNLDNTGTNATNHETGNPLSEGNGTVANPMAGHARWVREDEIVKTGRRLHNKPGSKRIYVHLQVDAKSSEQNTGRKPSTTTKVFHRDKNLVPPFKLNAKNVITSVTDASLAPGVKGRGKNVRPGGRTAAGHAHIEGSTKTLLKPVLQSQAPASNVRYQIKVNGLSIYMYKHFVVKLDGMDALVNAVSTSLKTGGMVAKSMFDNAGQSVTDEVDIYLRMHGQLKIGQNLVTSAGQIPTLGIIHVAAPIWQVYVNISEEECVKDLHKTIYDALKTAEGHQYRKVGLPVISAEPYFGVPRQVVADVYVKALVDYSLAMGPMYPVLEIHIVDMDGEMLNLIKESYEKWAASPAFANMKTEFGSRENSVSSPTELSKRAESAVNLKSARSHRSQNMVTFMEQSYTAEGNQVWTFEVLGKLLVHVYTGSLVNVEEVDGLACGVDKNMKGTLAKQFLLVGGPVYERALKKARGKMELDEGDVIVSDAGGLNADTVLHSIVASPIYRVSRKNLSRLDNINNEVLHTANQMDIKRLALPLIATARLREAFEVEQCSLQLVDNIIEFSLSMEKNLRIRELHLVNVNSTTTQALTQALRTRAHTKLRVEVDRNPPSRQDVLSTVDTYRQMSDTSLHNTAFKDGDVNIEHTGKLFTTRKDVTEAEAGNKAAGSNSRNVHIRSRRKIQYLSEKNLKEHEKAMNKASSEEKMASTAVPVAEANDEMGKIQVQSTNKVKSPSQTSTFKQNPVLQMRSSQPAVRPFLEDRKRGPHSLPKLDLTDVQRSNDVIRTVRQKQRTPIRGPIMLKSRAESYREIYERRKSIVVQRRNEYARLRRARSIDNTLFTKENADKVYEMFKTERKKLKTLRATNSKMEESDMGELVNKYSNFFTRGTRERYRVNAGHNIDDKNFEMTYKLNPDITTNDTIPKQGDVSEIFDQEAKAIEHADRNMNSRFKMVDRKRDREEKYMMDMAYGLPEPGSSTDRKQNGAENGSMLHENGEAIPLTNRSEMGRQNIENRYENVDDLNHVYHSDKNDDKGLSNFADGGDPEKMSTGTRNKPVDHNEAGATHEGYVDQRMPEKSPPLLQQFDQYVSETDNPNDDHINAIAAAFDQYVTQPDPIQKNTNKAAPKDTKRAPLNHGTNVVQKVSKAQTTKGDIQDKSKLRGTAVNSQHTPREMNVDKREHFKTATGSHQPGFSNPGDNRTVELRAPKPEDVTIRDKLRLEIDVVNKKDLESEKLKKEKKKIRRFWEVVDDSKEMDGNTIYGDDGDDNEKVLVAKVTKERKMSAKSKASKSNVSTVTQPIGKYNVTVEVA